MKLGNTSQTIIPVPNFFLTRDLNSMEAFHITKDKRKYFREKDLFRMTRDMNYSNNPRNNHRKYEEYNKNRYIPNHSLKKLINYEDPKHANSELLTKECLDFKSFKDYMKKTNVSEYTNPELRESIRTNINSLLDRINSNFDVKKWSLHNTSENYNKFNTEIKFQKIKEDQDEEDGKAFKETVHNKLISLSTVEEKKKTNALFNHKRMTDTNFPPKESQPNDFNDLNRTGLPIIKKAYNVIDYQSERAATTGGDLLSPTRNEFSKMEGEKISHKRRKVRDYVIDETKYNCFNHRKIFCEPHSTNENLFKYLSKKPRDTFI